MSIDEQAQKLEALEKAQEAQLQEKKRLIEEILNNTDGQIADQVEQLNQIQENEAKQAQEKAKLIEEILDNTEIQALEKNALIAHIERNEEAQARENTGLLKKIQALKENQSEEITNQLNEISASEENQLKAKADLAEDLQDARAKIYENINSKGTIQDRIELGMQNRMLEKARQEQAIKAIQQDVLQSKMQAAVAAEKAAREFRQKLFNNKIDQALGRPPSDQSEGTDSKEDATKSERSALPTLKNETQKNEDDRQRRILKNRDVLNARLATLSRRRRASAKSVSHRQHRGNYILTHRFYIEMGGVIRAAFNECSGFGFDIKKELYLEGGVNEQQRVMLGHPEFQDTVLKRGMTNDASFWAWIKETLSGQEQRLSSKSDRLTTKSKRKSSSSPVIRTRRNINILMMNQAGQIMQICTLIGAIPIGWKSPAFLAGEAAVAIEEMTVAYEGINLRFEGDETLGAGGATDLLLRDSLGFFPEN